MDEDLPDRVRLDGIVTVVSLNCCYIVIILFYYCHSGVRVNQPNQLLCCFVSCVLCCVWVCCLWVRFVCDCMCCFEQRHIVAIAPYHTLLTTRPSHFVTPSPPPSHFIYQVDAKHVSRHLDEAESDPERVSEAVEQVALADTILLNKTDLVSLYNSLDTYQYMHGFFAYNRVLWFYLFVCGTQLVVWLS